MAEENYQFKEIIKIESKYKDLSEVKKVSSIEEVEPKTSTIQDKNKNINYEIKESSSEERKSNTIGDFKFSSLYLALSYTDGKENQKQYSIFGYVSKNFTYFAKPSWFMLWFCLILFFKSMVMNAFVNVSLVSIEKRYKLSSQESSMIVSMYDIGCLAIVIPVSYYGNKGHKPIWIGFGSLFMGIGGFVYALPYFLSGYYEIVDSTEKEISLCSNLAINEEICIKTTIFSNLQNFKYFFYIAQFITGCGSTSLYTLGFSYIEDIYDEGTASLFIGVVTAVIAISSAVGFIFSGIFLNIYVDWNIPLKTLTPNETDIWVGAWWMGFLLSGCGQVLFALPLIFFPKGSIINKHLSKNDDDDTIEEATNVDHFDILKAMKNILFNFTYIFISLATTVTALSTSGTNSFGPKYIELVYGTTSGTSSIIAGAITLPPLVLGSIIGGYILKKFKWKIEGMLTYMTVTCLISIPTSFVLLLRCGDDKMAGVNSDYLGMNSNIFNNLTSTCNVDCNCVQNHGSYRPSCGADNINYFSPCFAGCKNKFQKGKVTTFNNCSCLSTIKDGFQLVYSKCLVPLCSIFFLNMLMLAFLFFISFMRVPPSITATMRCVKNDEKSLALGIRSIINRILGSLPGPIIFGSLIDRVCILWGIECKLKGNCLKYDIISFTRVFTFWLFLSNFLTAVFYGIPILLNWFKSSRFTLD